MKFKKETNNGKKSPAAVQELSDSDLDLVIGGQGVTNVNGFMKNITEKTSVNGSEAAIQRDIGLSLNVIDDD